MKDFEFSQKSPVPIGARVAARYGPNGCKSEFGDESAPMANAGIEIQRDNGCRQAEELITSSSSEETSPKVAMSSTPNQQVRIRDDSSKVSELMRSGRNNTNLGHRHGGTISRKFGRKFWG